MRWLNPVSFVDFRNFLCALTIHMSDLTDIWMVKPHKKLKKQNKINKTKYKNIWSWLGTGQKIRIKVA